MAILTDENTRVTLYVSELVINLSLPLATRILSPTRTVGIGAIIRKALKEADIKDPKKADPQTVENAIRRYLPKINL